MKVIGLIGGMSWESTVSYYRYLNEAVKARLGGLHSARVVLHSVDFHPVEQMQREGRWEELGQLLAEAAAGLEQAGAQCILVCANTMHKVVPAIEAAVSIPLLHIMDATGEAVRRGEIKCAGLLGTKFTMEQDFCAGRLRKEHGLEVVIPDTADRDEVHRVIFEELCLGKFLDRSRDSYLRIINQLIARGAQGIIMGCTEIPMLIKPEQVSVPSFDTTKLHAHYAVQFACRESPIERAAGKIGD